MSDIPTNTLTLVIDQVVLGEHDAEIVAAIDVRPAADAPAVSLLVTTAIDGRAERADIGVFLTKAQALLLGQFLMLSANVKEPS